MTQSDTPQAISSQSSMSMVKRLFRDYIRHHIGLLLLALVFMIIAAAMTAAFAGIIEPIIDQVLVAGETNRIWGLGFAIFLIFFIRGIAGYLDTILMWIWT